MKTYPTEQKTLLPLTSPAPQLTRRRSTILDSCALALILFLAASQNLILYGVHSSYCTPHHPAVCVFLNNLAAGLRLALPASLPTATLMFIASPYVVRPERMLATWYLIVLCCQCGSTLGALLLMWV